MARKTTEETLQTWGFETTKELLGVPKNGGMGGEKQRQIPFGKPGKGRAKLEETISKQGGRATTEKPCTRQVEHRLAHRN